MIPQSQISKLSNRLLKEYGGRRIPESTLERDYCIAWFLVGLSRVSLRDKLAFKGGTALRRCYFSDYRFSEDLDFTLLTTLSFEALQEELKAVYEAVQQFSNIIFRFSRPDAASHKNCYTFYLSYEGPLPITSTRKEIKVDVTIKEHIHYPPENMAVLKSHEEFFDLPNNEKILTYSLAEIATEKTVALHDRARTEPRDLYDLWYLTVRNTSVELTHCIEAIKAKLAHRGKAFDEVQDEFIKKEARLNIAWEKRLGAQMASIPEFENVYRGVKRVFRQVKNLFVD